MRENGMQMPEYLIGTWITERVSQMLRSHKMWGCGEAYELQLLALIEAEAVSLRKRAAVSQRAFIDTYAAFCRREFGVINQPLFKTKTRKQIARAMSVFRNSFD